MEKYEQTKSYVDKEFNRLLITSRLQKEEAELKKLEPEIAELRQKRIRLEEKIDKLPMDVRYQCGDDLEKALNLIDDIIISFETRKEKYLEEREKYYIGS